MFVLKCTVLLVVVEVVQLQTTPDPTFSPTTLSDTNGNLADQNSNISWTTAPPSTANYTTISDPLSDGQLGPFLDMMRGFVNMLQPGLVDAELLAKMYNGTKSISQGGVEMGIYLFGYILLVVLGILFTIGFPILGCMFCSRRLNDKWGGRRVHKNPSDYECIAFSVTLSLLLSGQFMGIILMGMVNDRVSYSIRYLDYAATNSLADLSTYLGTIQSDLEYVAVDGLKFAIDVMERDLDNRGYLAGIDIRDNISAFVDLTDVITNVSILDSKVSPIYESLNTTDTAHNNFISYWVSVNSIVSTIYSELAHTDQLASSQCTSDTTCDYFYRNYFPAFQVIPESDPRPAPSLTESVNDLAAILNNNMTQNALEMKSTFDNLVWVIVNETQNQTDVIKQSFADLETKIQSNVDSMSSFSGTSGGLDNIKSQILKFTGYLDDYNTIRSAAFWSITITLVVAPVIWLVAVNLGSYFYSSRTDTRRRPEPSQKSAYMLLTGAGCTWSMAFFTAAAVTSCFIVGYPAEKFFCDPLTDPEYKAFKYLVDEPGSIFSKDGYYMGELIFNNGSINLTLSGVLDACRNNASAYTALQLSSIIDIDSVIAYNDTLNITYLMSQMKVNYSNLEIIGNELETQLNQLKNATSVNLTTYSYIYSHPVMTINLTEFNANLSVAAAGLNPAVKGKLQESIDKINDMINNGSYTQAEYYQSLVISSLNSTISNTAGIADQVDETIINGNAAEVRLKNGDADAIHDYYMGTITSRLISVLDSYVDYVTSSFSGNIGRCTPIWTVWNSVVNNGMCHLTVDSFNGFWFALGMTCTFAYFSILFSIKLSRYLRRMKYDAKEEQELEEQKKREQEDLNREEEERRKREEEELEREEQERLEMARLARLRLWEEQIKRKPPPQDEEAAPLSDKQKPSSRPSTRQSHGSNSDDQAGLPTETAQPRPPLQPPPPAAPSMLVDYSGDGVIGAEYSGGDGPQYRSTRFFPYSPPPSYVP